MPSGARLRSQRQRPNLGGGSLSRPPKLPDADRDSTEIRDKDDVPYIIGDSNSPWLPSSGLLFKLFLTVRLSAAVWTSISDCDETFNYWEPLHFFLFGKGFQTWEYSPEYALRSYLYILMHVVPAWVYQTLLQPNPMYIFFFVRCILSVVCTISEVYFINGVFKEIGTNVARITLIFLVLSCGMFLSATALLPSTTSMYLTMLSYGAWFNRDFALAIFFTAFSTFISWPFAGVIGIPIALDVLRRKKIVLFIRWCVISAFVIILPQVYIDSQYYGKTVLAPLNIVLYNVFTSHGPDLYGTEDWKFYFMNGFLNFNVCFALALLYVPLHILTGWVIPSKNPSPNDIPKWLHLLGLFLWLLIFMSQPHKEERFLFPVYPLLALAAAIALDCIQKLFFHTFIRVKNRHYLEHTNWISISTIIIFTLLSASRGLAVYNYYSAPMSTWIDLSHMPYVEPELYPDDKNYSVCVGKEWYRFPSSFFLPGKNWDLKYLRSEFRGQLPQPYLSGPDATKVIRDTFNDQNRMEENRFETAPEDCDFLVDLDSGKETELEPRYALDTKQWIIRHSHPFLLSEKSNRLFRAFYVPFVSSFYINTGDYVLLENVNLGKNKKRKKKAQ